MENDLISRETAKAKEVYCKERHEYVVPIADLDWLPAVDAAPVVHGHVLNSDNPICGPCSRCGKSVNRKWCYCPNCGAKMEGTE